MKKYLYGILALILVYHVLYILPLHYCVFTCTTFFDFKTGDRWDRFCAAMDSLGRYHTQKTLDKISRWVVINEYSEGSTVDWVRKVEERYPWMECIQKGAHQKGQARSMNLCLSLIGGNRFWIHWEEAWETRATFLDDAFAAMENSDITQLQFTYNNGTVNWMDVAPERISCGERVCRIDAASTTAEQAGTSPYEMDKAKLAAWPLYSLLPSINRVRDYLWLGEFSEDPQLWPVKFEWDYARRWWARGNKKAVLMDGPVYRPGQHTSTYA
jgi:hypothetical protein